MFRLKYSSRKRAGPFATVPLDVHLMVSRPEVPAARFAEMGVRSIAVHVESEVDFAEIAKIARSNGTKVHAALRHTTPVAALDPLLEHVDGCLFLTAPAGGGAFDQHAFKRLSQRPKGLYTIVDGKIIPDHFKRLAKLEVDVAVVGAALFAAGETEERARAFARMLGSRLVA
ncbi:pentose-5-phosphate-3-epimerase [Rhizobium freirei PRF 81]|uniref:Pentose-5-phosphate-3-epimerase n=1 Tax=Rhizobium freirei PRF 81 TaxID=363754 RepID=N6U8J3_9HYPH|nr:pentose-5-phosphate-3-epimerase [Rhizobium freirei]ENN86538.1 pentose-5-phosphate-3-epimerase [Rhizobium freirei PRF 81]